MRLAYKFLTRDRTKNPRLLLSSKRVSNMGCEKTALTMATATAPSCSSNAMPPNNCHAMMFMRMPNMRMNFGSSRSVARHGWTSPTLSGRVRPLRTLRVRAMMWRRRTGC